MFLLYIGAPYLARILRSKKLGAIFSIYLALLSVYNFYMDLLIPNSRQTQRVRSLQMLQPYHCTILILIIVQ